MHATSYLCAFYLLLPYKHFKTFKRKWQKAIVSRVNHWKWNKACHEIRLNTKMAQKTYCLAILLNWNIITFRKNNAYKSHGFCAGSIFHPKKRRKRKEIDVEKKIYSKCEIYLLDIKETSVRGSLLLSWQQKAPFFGPLDYFGRSFYAIARGYLALNQLNGFRWHWPFFRQRMFPDFFIKWIMWFCFLCLMIWLS